MGKKDKIKNLVFQMLKDNLGFCPKCGAKRKLSASLDKNELWLGTECSKCDWIEDKPGKGGQDEKDTGT